MVNHNDQIPDQKRNSNKSKFTKTIQSSFWQTQRGRWTMIISIILVILLSGYLFRVIRDVTGFGDNIFEDVKRENLRQEDISLKNGDPISILIVGVDKGALFYKDVEEARTDVMMVLTIDPKHNTSTILSIPRDTLGPIGNSNDFDKLNHAYMNDGMEATIASIQRFLDIPIDHYVEVNMQGFMDVIDGLGGIKIKSPLTFTQNGATFTKGETRILNGEEAMHYARMRKADPEGDIGRQKRQQQVVEAVIDEVLSLKTITNYDQILDKLQDNVKTDFKVSNAYDLQANYLDALSNMKKYVIKDYSDLNLWFGYYLHIPESQRIKMSNKLRATLGLENTDSAIVYPVTYGIENDYFYVEDLNLNGTLEDEEMAIKAGVYKRNKLDKLVKEVFGDGGSYFVSGSNSSASSAESEADSYSPETDLESDYYSDEGYEEDNFEPLEEPSVPVYEEDQTPYMAPEAESPAIEEPAQEEALPGSEVLAPSDIPEASAVNPAGVPDDSGGAPAPGIVSGDITNSP